MAYKQTPGRGNMPKTGRGMSPALMGKCGSPMKQMHGEAELTGKGAASRKKAQAEVKKGGKVESQGISLDPKSGTAKANAYEKKFIPGDQSKGVKAKIVDGSGKLVKEAKAGGDKELKREYSKDSTNTMNARNANARFLNVQTGSKNPNAKEIEAGKKRSFYKK